MVSTILSLFPDAHISSGYARVRCPYHKDGKEKKPSMSILLEPRGNAPRGLCHCFACGKAVMFDQLLKDMGAEAMPAQEINGAQHREGVTVITTPPVYKPQLPFRFSPYLAGRGIGEDVQKRFKVFEKDDFVHMPVFDRHGMYLYDNARSTTSKRFYVEAGAKKSLWAIEEIDLSRLFAGDDKHSGVSFGWNDLLVEVAKENTLGNIDRVDEEPLFSVLSIMWHNYKERKRNEQIIKASKAH